jgi:hypothetical protein
MGTPCAKINCCLAVAIKMSLFANLPEIGGHTGTTASFAANMKLLVMIYPMWTMQQAQAKAHSQ